MPIDPATARRSQGQHQTRHQGADGPSREARRQHRFGHPAGAFNLRGLSNQFVFMLLASAALQATQARGAASPAGRSAGLIPAAQAAETLELGQLSSDGATAADSLLPAAVPQQVVNAVADGALHACALTPRNCGIALGATAVATVIATAAAWLTRSNSGDPPSADADPGQASSPAVPRTPAPPPYALDRSALPPPLRFNASGIDPTISACHSLGGHINHRWETSTALEQSRTRLGTFDQLRDRSLLVRQQLAQQMADQPQPDAASRIIGDLWATGMDPRTLSDAGASALQPELDRIAALQTPAQLLEHVFASSARARNPLFQFAALPDLHDPSTYLAYLGQGGLGLPDSAWYADPGRAGIVSAYTAHIARMLGLSGMPAEQASEAAARVIALEEKLAAASEPFAVLANDASQFYNPVDLDQASVTTPLIDWQRFFLLQGLQPPARFSLGMPGFFQALEQLLQQVPLETWQAYLRFHAADRAAPCLDSRFTDAHDDFHGGVLKGRQARVPRWAQVLDVIEHSAGEAFGPAYIQATFPQHASQRMQSITSAMSQALERRLLQAPWMEQATREQAVLKANRLRIDVGHPASWPSWDAVETQRASFLHNIEALDTHVHQRNIARVGHPIDADAWKITAQTVDAYHDDTQQRIVLPAALLQPPFFDEHADDALNYGGIGVVIGHEMAHAFDSGGSMFDAEGRLRDWWSEADHQRFDALAARLTAQYDQLRINGVAVDGALTLDENLADLGGLAIALDAMQQATRGTPDPMLDGMTREQRFFANFAFTWRGIVRPERTLLDMATDNHVPGSLRADGAPSNLPAFADAFNCKPGMPMTRPANEQVRFL